jgi:hypothetical protein
VGPEAPDFSNQVHDFDPGLDNGLFWTVPVDTNSLFVNPGSGRASLVVKNLEMEDYGNVVNALLDGPSSSVTVSFEVQWAPGVKHFKVRDAATEMAGEFNMNTARMVWSAESNGVAYQSGPIETSSSVSGQVGHERNGVFFS